MTFDYINYVNYVNHDEMGQTLLRIVCILFFVILPIVSVISAVFQMLSYFVFDFSNYYALQKLYESDINCNKSINVQLTPIKN